MFAKVIVDIVHSNVDKVFEYRIEDNQKIALGHRVLVPFGITNKVIEGFVIGTSNTSEYDEKKIKSIIEPLESYPVLNYDQLELAEYMREEYGCTLAEAIRLMLPSRLHGLREKMLLCAKVISSDISCLYTKNGKEKAPAQLKVYNYLSKNGETLVCDIEKKIKGAGNAVNGLMEKGIVAVYKKEIERKPYQNAGKIKKPVTLNKEQSYAVETISKALESGGKFLLHGITGSGKTEVYMRVVQKCLEKGRGAIILVPEIALT
ncbi:MAG: DEAD/DEAH box helicase family protein, partial [Clostridia bacterium]|nr:DEAD/DEAH box helicase family protein [Clostridia bacterium]